MSSISQQLQTHQQLQQLLNGGKPMPHRQAAGGSSKPKSGGAAATIAKRFSRAFQGGGGGNQQQQQQHQKKSDHHHQRSQKPAPIQVMSSAAIQSRVYILGSTDDSKRVAIKEVMYVDPAKSKSFTGKTVGSGGRPFWVPETVQHGCWATDPPCFWKVDSVAMQDLESGGHNLMYNPLSDYSLELMRRYRPDLFENLFHLFCVWNKRTYSSKQLQQVKDLTKPELLTLDDLDANFSPDSPVAETLRSISFVEDILPEIEHYLMLFGVRAFRLRDIMTATK